MASFLFVYIVAANTQHLFDTRNPAVSRSMLVGAPFPEKLGTKSDWIFEHTSSNRMLHPFPLHGLQLHVVFVQPALWGCKCGGVQKSTLPSLTH